MDRIIGAFTFRKGVYAEVEHDPSFTTTAYIIVAIVAILNQIGANALGGFDNLLGWAGGTVVGTIFALVAFAVGVAVVSWVGRTIYKAEVTYDELVRTLGLAYVWQVIGVIGVLSAVSLSLTCIVAPIQLVAALAGLAAWFVAAKEALDLEWIQTIITVVAAWIVVLIITFVAGAIIGLLGFGAAAAGGLLG